MSGASNVLDPVEAAQADIDRSKHLIASTLDDLRRHHHWLESYHRAERLRVQRLRRQELLGQLESERRHTMRALRRFTLRSAVLARNGLRRADAFLCWAVPRGRVLTILSWRKARALSRAGYAHSAAAFDWSVRTSGAFGLDFRTWLSAETAVVSAEIAVLSAEASLRAEPVRRRAVKTGLRLRLRATRLATPLAARAARDWTRARTRAPVRMRLLAVRAGALAETCRESAAAGAIEARARCALAAGAASKAAADGWTWVVLHARALPTEKPASLEHRALVVRRCTALVCIQPPRARLPVVRAG